MVGWMGINETNHMQLNSIRFYNWKSLPPGNQLYTTFIVLLQIDGIRLEYATNELTMQTDNTLNMLQNDIN